MTGCSALRFGAAAVRAIAEGAFGVMVGLKGPGIDPGAAGGGRRPAKNVPLDSDTIATARSSGSAWVTEALRTSPEDANAMPATRHVDVTEILHGEPHHRSLSLAGGRGDSGNPRAGPSSRTRSPRPTSPRFPGARRSGRRLEELLAIGVLSVPDAGTRAATSTTAARGGRTSRCSTGGMGVDGADRVAVDPNALNAAGTTALDWYYPSEDGRLLAYGLSENGSEESVLHLLDLDTGGSSPDRIPRMRAAVACLASRQQRLLLHPLSRRQERCPRARSTTTARSTSIGSAPIPRPIRWSSSRPQKEYWPGVSLSPDGRWLIVSVARTFDQTDLYLQDLASDGPAGAGCPGSAGVLRGRGRPRPCSSCAPISMRRPTGCTWWIPSVPTVAAWREIVRHRDGRRAGERCRSRQPPGPGYLERASSRLRLTDLEGRHSPGCPASRPWAASSGWAPSGTAASCSTASRPTPCLRASTGSISTPAARRSGAGWRPTSTPRVRGPAGELCLQGRHPDLHVPGAPRRAWCATETTRPISPAMAGSTSA